MLRYVMVGMMISLILALQGYLSYKWSFTATTFGGWLGFLLPLVLAVLLFCLGVIIGAASENEKEVW